jgi:hypothetical protein
MKYLDNQYFLEEEENMESIEINTSYLLFFNEQLRFYAHLAASRNKDWKIYLQSLIPFNYIVSKINCSDLKTDTRSLLLGLALNLFVDQDPLEESSFKKYHRTIEQCDGIKINSPLMTKNIELEMLLNEGLKYLNKKVEYFFISYLNDKKLNLGWKNSKVV